MKITTLPKTISEMLETYGNDFYTWQAENVQSGGYSRNPDERDRYNRCYDAAENGSDGSTHAENIQDFRDFGDLLFSAASREMWRKDLPDDDFDRIELEIDSARAAYMSDCDICEAWHDKNGSLNQQVG